MDVIASFEDEYEFLSNFYECAVTFEGLIYGSSEAAFQAQKTSGRNSRRTRTCRTNFLRQSRHSLSREMTGRIHSGALMSI